MGSGQFEPVITDDGNPEPSLQERFEVMRSRRRAAAARVKAADNAKKAPPRPLAFRQTLRQRFVDTALAYVGTPYSSTRNPHARTAEPPLFLDCCGLIRRVLIDLKEEFGFEVCPWNQSYLFDTLPQSAAVDSTSSLEPGDLIFWTATYDDPLKRKAKHDLVHVEIFLGGGKDGESTVGSRYEFADVGDAVPGVHEFSTYRSFGGHGAHGHRTLFRKIDAWLEGACINHCRECTWGELRKQACGANSSLFLCADADRE